MAIILIGYKNMKNKNGKVLYFGETNPWTTGVCINEDKRYSMGFVFDEAAENITEADIGKAFRFGLERV